MSPEHASLPLSGILAFGSLIWEPGELVSLEKVGEVICTTPWPVEFGRSSRRRGWAPTLVKVRRGLKVRARVLLYRDDPDHVEATLAKREGINLAKRPKDIKACLVPGVSVKPIWYSGLAPNITRPSPHCLARLAIASVKPCPEGNGIRYLRECLKLSIRTSMTQAYRDEILRITGQTNLEEAEQWASR
jgi:hypothetical protein